MENEVLALRKELTEQKRLLQEVQTLIQPLVKEHSKLSCQWTKLKNVLARQLRPSA